jgi:glycosyltransferase involved in cell wall biosynthesis
LTSPPTEGHPTRTPATTASGAFRRPRVLMATFFDWKAPVTLGSHHIARGFVRAGWDVGFVSSGLSPVQILRDGEDFRRRLRGHRRDGVEDLDGRLWAYTPCALLTPHNVPLLRRRALHEHWQRLTVPSVTKVVRDRGFADVDLLYVDAPVQAFWLAEVRHRASVARIADRYSGFAGVADELLRLETKLIQGVDLTVYSATTLEEHVRASGARQARHLPNGVEFDQFVDPRSGPPEDLRSIPRPIAIFVGSLGYWFDVSGMNAVTAALPEVSFVLIGPDQDVHDSLLARPNVHRLGPRPHAELPRYLAHADVGLIPYDALGHPERVSGVHPLKLYEYLAAGLPVVASRWLEIERIGSPAILYDTANGFVEGIRLALQGTTDRAAGLELARQADWTGRVRLLIEWLGLSSLSNEP